MLIIIHLKLDPMKKDELIKKLDNEHDAIKNDKQDIKNCILNTKPAKTWVEDASKKPIPNQLVGSLFSEQELCILYADTNVGKSILAVQIADAISKGKGILGLANEATTPQNVLYLDFEMSESQFMRRYSENGRNYNFSKNFYRSEINVDAWADTDDNFESLIQKEIETMVLEKNITVVIIDNMAFMGDELEKGKNAKPFMKRWMAFKKKHKISIIMLAHTPKKDNSKPIKKDDVAGSKVLINLSDSSFAIGRSSHDPSLRYIKQMKQRNIEEEYGLNNVIVCELIKQDSFLQFKFHDFDSELNHLENFNGTVESDQEFQQQIIALLEENPKYSARQIAEKLGSNHPKVGRHIKKMIASGMLVR